MGDAPQEILAIIGCEPAESDAVLRRAGELADEAGAGLTIAALAAPRWHMAWLASLASTAACAPPVGIELSRAARDRLAQAAEFAPLGVRVRTVVVDGPPRLPLRRMLAGGRYDLIVVGSHLASRRPLADLPIPALVVPCRDATKTRRGAGASTPLVRG
jgi:nucleotide-binding universal stress UspA family protein